MALSPRTSGRGSFLPAISALLGTLGRGIILLGDIGSTVSNSFHPELHFVLEYINVLAGFHSEATSEEQKKA